MAINKNKSSDEMRLQRFLSLAGVCSRRHAEELIKAGRVKISGRVVSEMGVLVTPGKSRVEVDNKPVFYSPERNYILFHKPTACITTLDDPEHRTTVIDLLPDSLPRVFPVGRLDWDTEGLLLLTNDGDLAYRLTHPSSEIPRVYHVKVRGELKDNSLELKKLKAGVELEDGMALPDRVAIIKFTGNNTWLEIELHIGRNRIVRRMFDAVGFPVMKLRRVSFSTLTLEGLPLGAYRDLTEKEVATLYEKSGDKPESLYVRNKTGVRFARGFDPKTRTMVRQAAPVKISIADREKSAGLGMRPRPVRVEAEGRNDRRVRNESEARGDSRGARSGTGAGRRPEQGDRQAASPRQDMRPQDGAVQETPRARRSFSSSWETRDDSRPERTEHRESRPQGGGARRSDRPDHREARPQGGDARRSDRPDHRESRPQGGGARRSDRPDHREARPQGGDARRSDRPDHREARPQGGEGQRSERPARKVDGGQASSGSKKRPFAGGIKHKPSSRFKK